MAMISNCSLTVYHKTFDEEERLEKWQRYNYSNVWWFGGKGASINKGYENANDVEIRISRLDHEIDVDKFSIGDILVKGQIETNIETQQDLNEYEVYNITSIKDNNFGTRPHLHIGGK